MRALSSNVFLAGTWGCGANGGAPGALPSWNISVARGNAAVGQVAVTLLLPPHGQHGSHGYHESELSERLGADGAPLEVRLPYVAII